jgi:hypothetical protein
MCRFDFSRLGRGGRGRGRGRGGNNGGGSGAREALNILVFLKQTWCYNFTIFVGSSRIVGLWRDRLVKTSVPDPWHCGPDADPYPRIRNLWLTDRDADADPAPALFVSDLKDASKK